MIFQHTIDKVLSGQKTQTRRIAKPEHDISAAGNRVYAFHPYRMIYEVGHKYSVQPARTAKGVAKIKITCIRREDVRTISKEDCWAEGFDTKAQFLEVWTRMHDPHAYEARPDGTWDGMALAAQWSKWIAWLETRPVERYTAWVLEFKLMEGL